MSGPEVNRDAALPNSMMSYFGQQEEMRRRAMPTFGERVSDGLQGASDSVAEAISPALRATSEFTQGSARVFHAGVSGAKNTARAGVFVGMSAVTEAYRNFMAHVTAAFSVVRRAVSTVVLRTESGISRTRSALAGLTGQGVNSGLAHQARMVREEALHTAADEAVRSAPRFGGMRERLAAMAPMANARSWMGSLQRRATAFTSSVLGATGNVLTKSMEQTRRLGPSFAAGCAGAAIPAIALASGILSPAHLHAAAAMAAEGGHHITSAVSVGGHAVTKAVSNINLRVGEQSAMSAYHHFMQSASAEIGDLYGRMSNAAHAMTVPGMTVQEATQHVAQHVHGHAHHLAAHKDTVSHGLKLLSHDDSRLAQEIAYVRDHSANALNGQELDVLKSQGHIYPLADAAHHGAHAAHGVHAAVDHHTVADTHKAVSSVSSHIAGADGHARVETTPAAPAAHHAASGLQANASHQDFGDKLLHVTGIDQLEKDGEKLVNLFS